ncbi:FAD-dependent oxidoreductase [Catenulispora sp. NL8]|uniref:FAD-dependent oxidoreductase n=1 Tax=Catenulispora pinistramenti TaxID=2705254 RepID=A0ABS5KRU7_9ACTN|nr:FAD-dependent oxidoreductase [Catenulispora pinistramenti]MBS2548778.1 FAD-dependent oxidoreductase [Catenulispora pinistramenti]
MSEPGADLTDLTDRADHTVIVGTGIAGTTAALTLRKEGYQGRITLVGAEAETPYRRPPLSKDVLRGTMKSERIRLKPDGFWAAQAIELRTGSTVTAIDTDASTVTLADGTGLDYRKLVLATGSRPRGLPQAAGVPGVHYLRSLHSATALASALAGRGPVVVIGGGLVGLEVAASARALGCAVSVLEAADRPMSRVLPAWLADPLTALHQDRGVEIHTGVSVARIERHTHGKLSVTAADGRVWPASVVVASVGTVPETALAEAAGLPVANGANGVNSANGIVVDEYGRTPVPGVFAAGDAANVPDLLHGGRRRGEHWNEAMEQGAAVAKTIVGDPTPYPLLPWSWSDQHGVTIQVCGRPEVATEHEVHGAPESRDASVVFRLGGKVVAVVAMNRPTEFRTLRQLALAAQH